MQTLSSLLPIREIMAQSLYRYASITPQGVLLPQAATPYNPLPVCMITFKPARTRYVNRKQICRSLDGVHSVNSQNYCARCQDIRSCTPQIALDFTYRSFHYRLLLAFTSAKNFIALIHKAQSLDRTIDGLQVNIHVVDRGRWGEASFEII